MKGRTTPEILILWIGGALVVLAFISLLAAIFVPDFREGGTTMVTVILGALGAAITSLLAGSFIRKEIGGAVEESKKSKDKTDDGETE